MPSSDMGRVEAFLADFISQLKARFVGGEYAVYLGGSAARGDFRAGQSDLDLIIYVHDDGDLQKMKDAAFPLFRELDERHGMRLLESGRRKAAERMLPASRPAMADYPPFLVVGPSSPGMGKGSDLFSRLEFLHGFSKSLTSSGRMSTKLIYGKRPPPAKAKPGSRAASGPRTPGLLSYDFLSALAMAPLSFIMPTRAYVRSMRAVFFAFEPDILRPASGSARAPAQLPRFVCQTLYSRKHLADALPKTSYPEKVIYCLSAPMHILLGTLWRARPGPAPCTPANPGQGAGQPAHDKAADGR